MCDDHCRGGHLFGLDKALLQALGVFMGNVPGFKLFINHEGNLIINFCVITKIIQFLKFEERNVYIEITDNSHLCGLYC